MDKKEIYQMLNNYFNQGELKSLYFELNIDYFNFTARTKSDGIIEFLKIIYEQGREAELVALVSQKRPFLFNNKTEQETVSSSPSFPTSDEIHGMDYLALYNFMINYLSFAQVQNICKDLGVDEKRLPGGNKLDKARELIVYIKKSDRLSDLQVRLAHHISGLQPLSQKVIVQSYPIPQDTLPLNIYEKFSDKEFEQLCDSFEVDIEDLTGADKVTSFVKYLKRRGLFPELVNELSHLKPEVPWEKFE